MSQAFSETALKGMEQYILTHVRTFIRLLADCEPHNSDENEKPSKNLAYLTNWFAFDVIGDVCFGKTFGMLTREEWRFWPVLIDNAIHRHAIVSIIPYSALLLFEVPNWYTTIRWEYRSRFINWDLAGSFSHA